MITALCLNPCVDRTVEIDEFVYGGMNRIRAAREDGSGKGVNVAIVASRLGMDASCIGFMGTQNAQSIHKRLEEDGVAGAFLPQEGAVRTNLKVLDKKTQVITEINESGLFAGEALLFEMKELVRTYARKSEYLVLTGSLPPGCPEDYYRQLIQAANECGCRCVLDAEGEKLTQGVQAAPYLIKPNLYELEMAVGKKLPTHESIRDAALGYLQAGVSVVAVSMGGEGAVFTNGWDSYFAPVLKVPVASTVGAGDSMVAGLLDGLVNGAEIEETFRRGVACAAASVTSQGTELVDPELYRHLISRVELHKI